MENQVSLPSQDYNPYLYEYPIINPGQQNFQMHYVQPEYMPMKFLCLVCQDEYDIIGNYYKINLNI